MGNSASRKAHPSQFIPPGYANGGFIPQYGPPPMQQWAQPPPPMMNGWPGMQPMMMQQPMHHMSTRRRKRRSRSTRRMPEPYAPAPGPPPVAPSVPVAPVQADAPRNVAPEQHRQVPRAATPAPPRSSSRNSHHSEPDISRILHPMTPATNPAVYGPPNTIPAPNEPLRNPLPAPPRDIYETSPYNALLDLPQTTALLTSSIGEGSHRRSKTTFFGRKKEKKGLFRSLTGGKSNGHDVHFVPVYIPESRRSTSANIPPPPPPPVTTDPTIRFDQHHGFSGFMNHAPYRVSWGDHMYPTATHLHEAMKFPDRSDVQDMIRRCANVAEVYTISQRYARYQTPDWPSIFMSVMEDIITLKFKQHPDLRALLLGTGNSHLIYSDPNDSFWGEGADGRGVNHLGHLLVKIRDSLRREFGTMPPASTHTAI